MASSTGYTAADKHREARELRDRAKGVEREIEQGHRKVQEAERLQWQFAGQASGDKARTAAAIVAVQRMKQRERRRIERMTEDKQNLEKQASEAEREAEQEKQRQREEARQRQQEKQRQRRSRGRGRDDGRDRDDDHDRDPF